MKTTLRHWLTAGLFLLLISVTARAETPVEQVARQFREYCLHESTDHGERLLDDVEMPKTAPDEAARLLGTLGEDGSWADLHYASSAPSSWPAATHLTRVLELTLVARRPDTAADQSAASLAAVHRALGWWREHDPRCVNWWYNDIGGPKILGTVALLLGPDLTADERDFITKVVLPRSKVGAMTGQNRVWLAANGAMRAALLADEGLLRQAAGVIQEELRVVPGEGIQADASFHQHGPQQQFGNYGLAFALEMARWATIFRGTPWAVPEGKLAILRRYVLDGESWVTWRGRLDISACGRQLFPGSMRGKANALRGVLRVMALADAGHAREFQDGVTRGGIDAPNDLVGNRYFWRSDYLVHRRPAWMASVKMSSNRVVGGETVNNENLAGLHLADGATFFYRDGREYDDIFPAWDWRMVPGVTSSLDQKSLRWPKTDLSKDSAPVGGVSDGLNGAAVLNFRRDDLHARKAWFFVGDTVVCLGADIGSDGQSPLITTINQCLAKTPITVQRAGKRETLSGEVQRLDDVDWIEQDGLRYTRLDTAPWIVRATSHAGNWRKVFDSPATPPGDVTKEIFQLWIAHRSESNEARYAYSVAPAATPEQPAVKVLANTGQLQAAQSGTGESGWIGAAFWDATARADLAGLIVGVDAPCIVLIDRTRVTVSDPTQKLTALRVKIDGRSTVIPLAQGTEAGKSVTVPRTAFSATDDPERQKPVKESPPVETRRQ